MKTLILIGLLLIWMIPLSSDCQVVLNEICPKNASLIQDEDGDDPDWIELRNTGDTDYPLMGHYLSDNYTVRWQFPDIILPAHQYLIVFASGKNRISPNLHTSFKLSDNAETISLWNSQNQLLDEVVTGHLHPNHSLGRVKIGSEYLWRYFDLPSPGATNEGIPFYLGYATAPLLSAQGGFYKSAIQLSIQADTSLYSVHYTIDGSIPSEESTLYTSELSIDSTLAIRVSSFSKSRPLLPSEVITQTYFVNFETVLPVFSISTNPGNLWDWNYGIYVKGPNASPVYPYFGANYWQEWEIPAHIEFYETNKIKGIDQDAGVSINGGSVSRTRPMQSLRLTARDTYGESEFNYEMFAEKDLDHFKNIVLRNSSGDFNKTHFRDGSLHRLMLGNVDVDLLCYRPSLVFLNGKYWGIQNIREKFSKFYLTENHGINPDNLDLLEEDSTIIQGDFTEFNQLYQLITSSDLSNQSIYNSVAEQFDIHSFCDYIIAETFLSNIDWPYNNMKYWKEKGPGHKWRYLLMDLDISLGNYGWAPAEMDVLGRMLGPYGDNNKHVKILRSLLRNIEFRNYFISRYADLINTLFTVENLKKNTLEVKAAIEPEMPRHFNRWGNNMQNWNLEIDSVVMPYIEKRPSYARQYVQDLFHLPEQHEISLDCWPQNAGKIKVNTVEPTLPWSGIYFKGVPVTLTIEPNPGFRFTSWISDNNTLENPQNSTIQVELDTNMHITAYFGQAPVKNALSLYPNPASDLLNASLFNDRNSNGTLSIYDLSGRELYKKEVVLLSGLNTFQIPLSSISSGIYLLRILTNESLKTANFTIYR